MSRQMEKQSVDRVELRRKQWAQELPDVDTSGMAILGRMRVATTIARGPIEGIFARHGLDAGEFDVLSTLLRSGTPYRLRPTELYKSLMISSGGLTNRLGRLEKSGLIKRNACKVDARSTMVELTPKGRKLAEQAFREDMEVEARLLDGLAPAERDQLAALLAQLLNVLEDQCGTAGADATS